MGESTTAAQTAVWMATRGMCGWWNGDGGPDDSFVCDPVKIAALVETVARLQAVAQAVKRWYDENESTESYFSLIEQAKQIVNGDLGED